MTVAVGDKIRVWWFTGVPGNLATVRAVAPCRGRYPEHFDCILTLTAPETKRGTLEMAYNSRNPVL
jgi:hypothetical protein